MAATHTGATTRRLTRDDIVGAALAHMESGNLTSLTVRKLARDLSVSPMALYRHVANKDDILLAVTDELLTHQDFRPARSPKSILAGVARALRELLTEHPELVGVYNRLPVTTPAARRRLEVVVAALAQHGWSRRRAVQAYAAVHTYTLGFCALEAARTEAGTVSPSSRRVDASAVAIHGFVTPVQFKHGLEALITGLVPTPDEA